MTDRAGLAAFRASRSAAALLPAAPRGSVLVTGPDAWSFLQNLLSQDVAGLADGDGARALLLQPQGKLEADLRVLRVGDDAELDCEAAVSEVLAGALGRYKIRVQLDVLERGAEWSMASVRGPEAGARVAGVLGVAVPDAASAHRTDARGVRVVRADWPGFPGVDLLGPARAVAAAVTALADAGLPEIGPDGAEAMRIEAVVPRQGIDLDDSLIPQEAFLDESAVSFSKGCFVGQELVCRIDTRGHVNRYLRRLDVTGEIEIPPGSPVLAGDREVGTVTSAAVVPGDDRTVALALVRREVDPGDRVRVADVDAVVAGRP